MDSLARELRSHRQSLLRGVAGVHDQVIGIPITHTIDAVIACLLNFLISHLSISPLFLPNRTKQGCCVLGHGRLHLQDHDSVSDKPYGLFALPSHPGSSMLVARRQSDSFFESD